MTVHQNFIDWNTIWAIHAPKFKNNKAHISLSNGAEILLKPGPGFGDASHPTTQLMLELMPPYVKNKTVWDIGCGSGILSIAAYKLGASKIFGCDICQDALAHAQENAVLNDIQKDVSFYSASSFKKSASPDRRPVVLMNMISSDQREAWPYYSCKFHTLISSGVLLSERDLYLKLCTSWGWKLIQEQENQGWLGFIFNFNLSC